MSENYTVGTFVTDVAWTVGVCIAAGVVLKVVKGAGKRGFALRPSK